METPIKPVKVRSAPTTLTESPNLKTLIPPRVAAVVQLPSRGVFYSGEGIKDGKVEIMPLIARDEKLLVGLTGDNIDEVVDTLLERCLITKMSLDDLIVTDKFYLMVALRANSYGEDLKIPLTCTACKQTASYTLKLPSDFEVKYAPEDAVEPFETTLPVTKFKVKYRLLRGKDQKAIKNFTQREMKKTKEEGDPAFFYRIAKQITEINGQSLEPVETIDILENLPIKDSRFLQGELDKNLPGIVTVTTKECRNCKADIYTSIPISAEFFRPDF